MIDASTERARTGYRFHRLLLIIIIHFIFECQKKYAISDKTYLYLVFCICPHIFLHFFQGLVHLYVANMYFSFDLKCKAQLLNIPLKHQW